MTQATARPIGLHVVGWCMFLTLVIAFVSSNAGIPGLSSFLTPSFLMFGFIYMVLFYFNSIVLLPRLYLRKKQLVYLLVIIFLFLIVYFLKPFERLVLSHTNRDFGGGFSPMPPGPRIPHSGFGRPPREGRPGFDIVSAVLFIATWAVSSTLVIINQWRITERRALQAESDKFAAELSFLKAQVNPHFLFNTLNNIYSLAITGSDHTAEAILKLSSILRYVNDDVRQDFVSLQAEIDCARNYIELQKLRLSKKVTVGFAVQGKVSDKKVAPLLLMTFIENAFKYGISSHENCVISIKIFVDHNQVKLFCQNKIIRTDAGEREGVGIKNAKKRLEYLYPGKHSLVITEGEDFTVQLAITT